MMDGSVLDYLGKSCSNCVSPIICSQSKGQPFDVYFIQFSLSYVYILQYK